MNDGWAESALAWIESLGEHGDYGRAFVLDQPMIERVRAGRFRTALDVGCGEGRFCRMLEEEGIRAIGLDPTESLITHARARHPQGCYQLGRAENMQFGDGSFDLVVSYLSLIDIPDIEPAIREMVRVLRPGGTLLIANLTSFNTAGPPTGWIQDADGRELFPIDHYLQERCEWVAWNGMRVCNWHRPLGTYMRMLLSQGLRLRHFSEPAPQGDDSRAARYRRVPFFLIMEWEKS